MDHGQCLLVNAGRSRTNAGLGVVAASSNVITVIVAASIIIIVIFLGGFANRSCMSYRLSS